jgi:hypothetical protein
MAETMSKVQDPLPDIDFESFQKGVGKGREIAAVTMRKVAAWAEENPGQVVVAGLLAGFVLGKLLFRKPAVILDDD